MKKLLLLISLSVAIYANINYKTNINKDSFLTLDSERYTIDLATLYDFNRHKIFIKKLDNTKQIYAFEFGNNQKKLVTKVLFGSFDKYTDALAVLRIFPKDIQDGRPQIVKIEKYQDLMKKYHTKNNIKIMDPLVKKLNLKPLDKLQYVYKEKISFLSSLEYVFKNHPDLKAQAYLMNTAKYDRDEQKALFLPSVDMNYDNTRYLSSYDSTGDPLKTKTISKDITAKWNIFKGFRDYNHYQLKHKRYTSTFFSKENITNDLVFSFIQAYVQFAKIQKRYNIAQDNLSNYKEYMEKMDLKGEYGMSSLTQKMSISKKYVNSQINFIEMNKKQYFDALYDMQNYINIDEKSQLIAPYKELNINMSKYTLQALIDTALEFHPLILQANSEIDLAKIEHAKEHTGYMPTLDLVLKKGEVESGYEDRTDFKEDTSIKFQFKMNLYNGGKDANLIKKRLNEYKQKQQEYQSTVLEINYGIKTSFYALKILEEKQILMDENLYNSQEAYKAAKYDFEFAKIAEDGVILAMESLKDAKQQSLEMKYEVLVAKYKVLFSTGILTQYLQDSINKRVIK